MTSASVIGFRSRSLDGYNLGHAAHEAQRRLRRTVKTSPLIEAVARDRDAETILDRPAL